MKTYAIALNTFREAIRNKALYSVIFFSVIIVLVATLFGSVSIGSLPKVVKDFGLFAISFFGAVLSIVAGVSLLNKELKQKTIYNILSKPVSRAQFICGKYFGLTATICLQVALMGMGLIIFSWLVEGKPDILLLQGILFALFEAILVCAIATFFSAVVITTTLTALYTSGVYIAGRSIQYLSFFMSQNSDYPNSVRVTAQILQKVLPNFSAFNISDSIVYGQPISLYQTLMAFGYCISYSSVLIALAIIIFEKRELT